MTKLIAVLIIVAVVYGGWNLFLYWEKVKNEKETAQKQQASEVVDPARLSGLPYQLEQSLQAAQKQGPAGLRAWLKTYGSSVHDPRKAWIELDYCLMVVRDDPGEARRVFKSVKE